jgi:uncharacterized protein (DUF1800 family)
MRKIALVALASVCLAVFPGTSASRDHRFSKQLSKKDKIDHALNRLTFGPRPGDAGRVRAIGLKKWIDLQLHPARVPENRVLEAKLQPLDSLRMTNAELAENFPPPQLARQMIAGLIPFPSDPNRRLLIENFARDSSAPGAAETRPVPAALRTGTPRQRLAALMALPAVEQNEAIAVLPPGLRQALFAASPPDIRRKLELASGPAQVVARDLMEAKVLRAVYGNRQLEEVLVDFWYNHFNVFFDKGADRFLVTGYERDAIRPNVLGKFRDLLEATAKSPAMLFYLDNWQSAGIQPGMRANPRAARRGLNENYGRELLELHTLGVDGGYTQKDVTEVARCFTGWTIDQPLRGGAFRFNPRLHDPGEKHVLGVVIPAGGGMEDGLEVLEILASHPSTAHFISWKLARRFVADDPPAALVDRMARTFLATGGDLREVMATMLNSREFWSEGAYRSKIKSPFELVVSAARASGAEIDFAFNLANQVAQLGEPLYRKPEPTGYADFSREWLTTAGLLARMNFAVQLAADRVPGVTVAPGASASELGSPEFQKK